MPPAVNRHVTATTTILLLSVVLLLAVIPRAAAADPEIQGSGLLFSDAGRAPASSGSGDPTALRQRLVLADLALLAQSNAGDTLGLNLFEDALYQGVIDDVTKNPSGSTSWIGHLRGEAYSQFVLVVGGGQMAGSVTLPGAIYGIRYKDGNVHVISEIDGMVEPREGPPIPVDVPLDSAPRHPSGPADDGSIIDVMVVYTQAARDGAGGTTGMLNLIDLAVSESNQTYANSGIAQRLRLVNSAEVAYEESGYTTTDLNRLRDPSDGTMDRVHALRDLFGADFVSLFFESGDYGGRAYLMTTVSSDFKDFAFSLVKRRRAAGEYILAHELGHNMGAHHDWYVNDTTQPYPYNHAFLNVEGRWMTVMGYWDECAARGSMCYVIPYWSNPDASYQGVPLGVHPGTSAACVAGDLDHPDCDADNRLTLNNTAFTVANFRQTTQPPTCFPLATSASPSAAGAVLSDPGPNCSGDYVAGTEVKLTPSPKSGYSFSHWSGACSGSSQTCTLTLSAAKQVAAAFEEIDYGRIIVDKVTEPAGAEQEFLFAVTGGPESIDREFNLTDAAAPRQVSNLAPGAYRVVEEVPEGWDLVYSSCDDGSDPGAIDLDPGETVTCTFSNQQTGYCAIPAAPVLRSPPNGTSTQDPMPDFEWSPATGAAKYRLRLAEVDSGAQVLSITTSKTHFTLETPLEPDTYYWRVRGLNDCGVGNWALRRSVTILPTRPHPPQLMLPDHDSLNCQPLPTLAWKGAKGATGYRLQVDNDNSFSSPVLDDGTADTEYNPPHGLSLGTYYWRVLASNSAGDSDWSSVWRFVQGRCIHLPLVTRGIR